MQVGRRVVAVSCVCLRRSGMLIITVLLAFTGLVPPVLESHAAGGTDHAGSTVPVISHAATAKPSGMMLIMAALVPCRS